MAVFAGDPSGVALDTRLAAGQGRMGASQELRVRTRMVTEIFLPAAFGASRLQDDHGRVEKSFDLIEIGSG